MTGITLCSFQLSSKTKMMRMTIFPQAPSPSICLLLSSFMGGFAFITETDGSSGQVASAAARKLICNHVIRTHWANQTGSGDPGFDVSTTNKRNPNKAKLSAAVRQQIVLHKDNVFSTEAVDGSSMVLAQPALFAWKRTPGLAESSSCHFTRATDAFVYADSSIDIKSYGFFTHYSTKCLYHTPA
jgi:hypothetical protein